MNGYNYLVDIQELNLERFRDFYHSLTTVQLDDLNNPVKLSDFIKTPELIEINNIINQKLTNTSVSDLPLVHYLIALINTPSAYQSTALIWAIFNTQCIELLDHQEHAKTVANLCLRFRLASTRQQYHWIYNFLPSLPLELKELLKFLNEAETENKKLLSFSKPYLSEKQLGQLAGIRVIYQYVHTQSERQKRQRSGTIAVSEPRQTDIFKTTEITLDNEQTHQTHLIIGITKQPNEDKNIEIVEDHNFEFNTLEQHSISAQSIHLKSKILHKNKNELMNKPNPRVFDLPTAQYIMNVLFEQAKSSPIHTLLLFSVLSLTHYKELPIFQKNSKSTAKTKSISLKPNQCFFKQNFEVSKFKDFVLKEHMLNTTNSFTIPLPEIYLKYITQLKKWDQAYLDSEVQEHLHRINKKLTFQLTAQNLPRLLSDITLNELGYELESKLLLGESVQHYIPCHYFSTKIIDILDIYIQAITLTLPQLASDYVSDFAGSNSFGSQQTPDIFFVKSFFKQLDQQVRKNPNPFQTLNNYSIWLWHICMLLTSARPNESFPPHLDYIDLENRVMAVADKEQRYAGTIGRYLPFNDFLRHEIEAYLRYLKHFQNLMKPCMSEEKIKAIQEVIDRKRPFLLFYDQRAFIRNLMLSDIHSYCKEIILQRNWTRHFSRYFLAQYCNEDVLKGIFGHDEAMQELFDRYSSFQPNDYEQIRVAQKKLVKAIELQSMSTFDGVLIV